MLKRLLIMGLILLSLGALTVYLLEQTSTTTLAETVSVDKEQDAFILHLRIENNDDGFRILHSLEYVGEEEVSIEHRTPLTYISFNNNRSNFTGSPVSKTLQAGDIYRPEVTSKIYEPLEAGTHTVYIHCQFSKDNQPINIKIEKEIYFQ